ncbi:MAG: hypothetical protein OEV74_21540 [Cyclobacteriaceae bacterium]|nr:hypothetical protein [Cyclobacteriaceae bacterium]MDH4298867.1 hypothetical protein [Cyclobacteriaceae bacterium]MDH5250730.1 hypothetical protein [Cyclobacteriaceae bacterium]
MFENFKIPNNCNCVKELTTGTLVFDIVVLAAVIGGLYLLRKSDPKIFKRFLIMSAGVLIFEVFTAPMWDNSHLGAYAYVYLDVSWILTFAWAILFIGVIRLVDNLWPEWREWKRFLVCLVMATGVAVILEIIVLQLSIRTYSPEVQERFYGLTLLGAPLEILYFAPVFSSLIIGFYKFWNYYLDEIPLVPSRKKVTVRNFIIALLGVAFFEIMIEPMVDNENFPSWSYYYYDVNIVLTLVWVLVIWLSTTLIDRFFIHLDMLLVFVLYVSVGTVLYMPIESWFIRNGYRVYGESATANFTGIQAPYFDAPVEVLFAIPLYLMLMLSFIRYGRIIMENKL